MIYLHIICKEQIREGIELYSLSVSKVYEIPATFLCIFSVLASGHSTAHQQLEAEEE